MTRATQQGVLAKMRLVQRGHEADACRLRRQLEVAEACANQARNLADHFEDVMRKVAERADKEAT